MPVSVVDFYRDYLPKTNCGDCSKPTCFAFATHVVVEKFPVDKCPHLEKDKLSLLKKTLREQYESGKWLKKDSSKEACDWARSRAASMKIKDLPERIGGKLVRAENIDNLQLPYFNDTILISEDDIVKIDGSEMTDYEKVFIYNHIAQGGSRMPSGNWKGFKEFPNTISKMSSMLRHVENPIENKFRGSPDELLIAGEKIGGVDITVEIDSSDLSLQFFPLPRIPIRLVFRDEIKEEDIKADVKLLFDETIPEHLDIESIMFLSERLRQLLCGDEE